MINYGKQTINQKDIDAVIDVLKSDFLTQGPQIEKFENEFTQYVGSLYAISLTNATSALHVACLALGVGQSDLVWTVPNSFVASANCALYCGAEIDFVDIDPETLNICTTALEKKLAIAKEIGRLPKVLIPVHFSGSPCDMKTIKKLADQYQISIIEDASHALGASYHQGKIGNCEFSDITVFSFHPVKIITTGEGGLATTNDEILYKKLKTFRSHGITRDTVSFESNNAAPWYYEQQYLGYNYRMTDLQAALGRSQLSRVDEFIGKRQNIAKTYFKDLANSEVKFQKILENSNSSWHLFTIQIDFRSAKEKLRFYEEMLKRGVKLNVHYFPIHMQPYFRNKGFKHLDFPISESFYEKAFSLPVYPTLDDSELNHVTNSIKEIIN